jgi:hypothetical protein
VVEASKGELREVTIEIFPQCRAPFPIEQVCGESFFLLGVERDVTEAFGELKRHIGDAAAKKIWCQFYPKTDSLWGFFGISYATACTREDLNTLNHKGGSFPRLLARLRRYFAVNIGNEHQLVAFPASAISSEFPDGNRTIIQLHFLVRRDIESIPMCLQEVS